MAGSDVRRDALGELLLFTRMSRGRLHDAAQEDEISGHRDQEDAMTPNRGSPNQHLDASHLGYGTRRPAGRTLKSSVATSQ